MNVADQQHLFRADLVQSPKVNSGNSYRYKLKDALAFDKMTQSYKNAMKQEQQ